MPRRLLPFLLLALLAVPAHAARPLEPSAHADSLAKLVRRTALAKVSFLTGASVYVDAGSLDGISEGDTVRLMRQGREIGALRVTFVSSHRASCDTLALVEPAAVGDLVSYVVGNASAAKPDTARVLVAAKPAAPRPARRVAPIRGRLGARMLWIDAGAGGAGDLKQPSVDARVDGVNLGGSGLDFGVDVRARRSTRTQSDGSLVSDNSTRIYRASLSLHDAQSHKRMTLGRQVSPTLASVSVFDGALAEAASGIWAGGLFSGTQPDPETDGFSSEILQHGLYASARSYHGVDRKAFTLGAVTSTHRGDVNRDFLFAQADWMSKRGSAYVAQEFDWYRGWRRQPGQSAFEATSAFAFGRYDVVKGWSLRAGYDTRRNVRLWRDRETPATQFDDRYRSGGWVGSAFEFGRHLHLDGDMRLRAGSESDRSNTWSVGGSLDGLTSRAVSLRSRFSLYDSDPSRSSLWTMSLSAQPVSVLNVGVDAGRRVTQSFEAGLTETVTWYGADGDLLIARRWFLNGSFERDQGGTNDLFQATAALSWRF